MAVNTSTALPLSGTITNAEFRAMYSFIADCLQAGGIQRTADTGQVDLATMNFPAANDAAAGYEIRAFSDALQATVPIFLKLEPARWYSANVMGFYITIGTGSDGAGNLTGIKWARQLYVINNATIVTGARNYVSAGTNRFAFTIGTAITSGMMFSLERTKDLTKTPTGAGLIMFFSQNSEAFLGGQYIPFSGSIPPRETVGCCFPPTQQTTGLHSNGNVAVYPCYSYGIGETIIPSENWSGVFHINFTADVSFTANILGSNQTMMYLGNQTTRAVQRGSSPTLSNFNIAMRYD